MKMQIKIGTELRCIHRFLLRIGEGYNEGNARTKRKAYLHNLHKI
jgi:hypothetical protein